MWYFCLKLTLYYNQKKNIFFAINIIYSFKYIIKNSLMISIKIFPTQVIGTIISLHSYNIVTLLVSRTNFAKCSISNFLSNITTGSIV